MLDNDKHMAKSITFKKALFLDPLTNEIVFSHIRIIFATCPKKQGKFHPRKFIDGI
jgi:hypothetical protein